MEERSDRGGPLKDRKILLVAGLHEKVYLPSMKIRDFRGKTVYLFGGSSGIGLETAKRLSEKGASVVLFARTPEKLRNALEAVRSRSAGSGQSFSAYPLDVSVHDDVVRVVEKAVGENGAPDILINCAGEARPDTFDKIGYEQFDRTLKVNLYGTWNTISVLLPFMKERGGRKPVSYWIW